MRSSWGPDLSFETLKSKFNCITNFFFSILVIFDDLGIIDFLPIDKDLQEILWTKVLLPYFEHFLSKNFLSSLEYFNFWQVYYIRSPWCIWLFKYDMYKLLKWTTIRDDIFFYRPLTNNAFKSNPYILQTF